MEKVVITGVGLVTPLGFGRERTWQNLINGNSSVSPDETYKGILSARIKNLGVPDETRLIAMSFLAASEAVKDSNPDSFENFGCTVSVDKPNLAWSKPNELKLTDLYYQSTVNEQLYRIFKMTGPSQSISAACSTGIHSVILGAQWIKQGFADRVLAGASDSCLHPLYIAGFRQMGVLASNKMCPFDTDREGFAVGEGAGMFMLERKDKALIRGAKIYGEILGCSMGNDPHDVVSFTPEGTIIAQCIKRAVEGAGIDTVDYIHAHGTATKLNDIVETRSIKKAFGNFAKDISISSTKAATGHLLGASGSLGLAFSLLALRDNIVPPTLNLNSPDPECGLDFTPNKAKSRPVNRAMTLAYGFGGPIGVIIMGK